MSRGVYDLYPNLFVLLVAESAKVRKSTAMNIGVDILQEAIPNIPYITGAMTPEGLVKQLNRTRVLPNEDVPEKPHVICESDILIHADELATLFSHDKQRASRMSILLTEIYGRKNYMHTIKTDAQVMLRNLYPTLLAGTDPRNLKVLPDDVVGGLVGRMIFVPEWRKRKPIAWPEFSDIQIRLKAGLIDDLKKIAILKGEIKPTLDARQLFKDWYEKLSMVDSHDAFSDAFMERCHDTALKIAMLISISRSDEMVLTAAHVAGGIKFIEDQLPEFKRVSLWAQTSQHSQNRAKFIDMLRRRGGSCDRKVLLKMMGLVMSEFNELEATLIQEDTIKIQGRGRQKIIITLSEEEMKR